LHDFQASAVIEHDGFVVEVGVKLPGLELAEPHLAGDWTRAVQLTLL
jgi:hypothetical protein